MNKITVITAAYNAGKFIAQTIDSVINQTLTPYQHVIIDDCSTDNTLEIIRDYEKRYKHIKVVHNSENLGFPGSLNVGIKNTKSEYVAILDADDIAYEDWLEQLFPVIESDEEISTVGGGCVTMTEHCLKTNNIKFTSTQGDVSEIILNTNKYMILHPGSLHRKYVLERVGLYNEKFKSFEDKDLFLNMSSMGKVVNIGKPLIYYRKLKHSESRKTKDYLELTNEILAKKAKLLRDGVTVEAANTQLNPLIDKLKTVKRTEKIKKGAYEYEMANEFKLGGRKFYSIHYYVKGMVLGAAIMPSLKGVIKLILNRT